MVAAGGRAAFGEKNPNGGAYFRRGCWPRGAAGDPVCTLFDWYRLDGSTPPPVGLCRLQGPAGRMNLRTASSWPPTKAGSV